ncbi:MAG: O-acetyl-ADP-ribose deacetylase [Candidatus Deferrimicrobium sp.]
MEKTVGGKVIELELGDITRQKADAIVNAANPSLLGGGGVEDAIHSVGGLTILAECRVIRNEIGGDCPVGKAVVTGAGRLAARYVIHAVGPVWQGGEHGERELLASCYRSALQIAVKLKLHTVAFPSISTGIYGYPVGEAATIALSTVASILSTEPDAPYCVRFVLHDPRTYATYTGALDAL